MTFSSENLLKQLDHDEIISWALELKYYHESFAFLSNAIKMNTLNLNQKKNALHALFRIGYNEYDTETIQIYVECSGDQNIVIRSESVQLAIGFVKCYSKVKPIPLKFTDEQIKKLKFSGSLGLSQKASELVKDYFQNNNVQ